MVLLIAIPTVCKNFFDLVNVVVLPCFSSKCSRPTINGKVNDLIAQYLRCTIPNRTLKEPSLYYVNRTAMFAAGIKCNAGPCNLHVCRRVTKAALESQV